MTEPIDQRLARQPPPELMALLLQHSSLWDEMEPAVRDLDSVELFSGDQAITNAFLQKGLMAAPFDRKHGEHQNIVSEEGFRQATGLVMRLRPGGALWGAPVCSSWVWISRSSTGRSKKRPEGNKAFAPVKEANKMVVASARF